MEFNLSNISVVNETVDDNATIVYNYSERVETYIVPIVFAIIFIVGVLGNGTLIIVFVRHRTMRNVPNT